MKYRTYALIAAVVAVVGFVASACRSGMEVTLQRFEGIVYLVAIATAAFSVLQYWENSKREASKWLHELYRGLYGDQDLQDVLWRLEPENTNDTQLRSLIDQDDTFGSRFDRFLNFFQFVAVLHDRRELDMKDVMSMFKFPLKLIRTRNAVVEYIRKEEYEFRELRALLERPELQEAGQ